MVTLLKPDTTQTILARSETVLQEEESNSVDTQPVEAFGPLVVGPQKTRGEASFIIGITRPLLALYDLVSGPAMTQRDRNRWAIGEANRKSNAALAWFNRGPWY